jgi:hypothetical protein
MAQRRSGVSPAEAHLRITLASCCKRHALDTDPAAALAELREIAGDRTDLLAEEAGRWAGLNEGNAEMAVLVDAIKALPGTERGVQAGRQALAWRPHSAPPPTGYQRTYRGPDRE